MNARKFMAVEATLSERYQNIVNCWYLSKDIAAKVLPGRELQRNT
jgi:hypothetical protein